MILFREVQFSIETLTSKVDVVNSSNIFVP